MISIHYLVVAAVVLSLASVAAFAQTMTAEQQKHRVVFEVTMDGQEPWEAVLNNVENLQKVFGADQKQIEVVAHGKALGFFLATDTGQQERMKKLAGSGVVFAACQNTMKRKNVTEKDLLPFVTTVDSGVAEVVRKQEAGWSYIKSGS